LSGVAVNAGQTISVANIIAGNLKFTPSADANGAGSASFTFQVQDNGGTLNLGADLDQTPNTLTIDVTAVDDAPVLGQNTLTLTAGATVTVSSAQLSATDVDNPAAGLLFTVGSVTHGQFELASAPTVAVVSFTQAQIGAGQVRFVHDASTSAPTYDVSVSDGTLTAGPATASISFSLNSTAAPSPGPVLPPPAPSLPSVPAPSTPTAPAPAPIPTLGTGGIGDAGDGGTGGGSGGGDGHGSSHGAGGGAATGVIGVLATDASVGRPVRVSDMRAVSMPHVKLSSGVLDLHTGLPPLEMGLLIQSSDPQLTKFEGSAPADWSITSAFNDESSLKSQQKEQFTVLLDSAQMGGIVFSVGVVWWASRVTGMIGSLLASMPAWRQLDPLPVVGRDDDKDKDKDEDDWQTEQDRNQYADELAISMVLEGPRQTTSMSV
jgi:hypothetical protein